MDGVSLLNQYLPSWTPTSLPTSTSISTINPTNTAGLALTLLELQNAIQTETNTISLYFLSRAARGVAASYTIISGQQYLATATATQDFPEVTSAMVNATLSLKQLEWKANLYAINLSVPFNAFFAAMFGVTLICLLGIGFSTKTKYFTICLACGTVLEVIGYVARTLAHYSWSDPNLFLCQIVSLTVAPAFIMAGVYYLLSQMIIIHGEQYAILKPIMVSIIFIFCDVVSLFVQASGGAAAAVSLRLFKDTELGTYIMVGGIGFQVVSMTLFLYFLFDFVYRSFFTANSKIKYSFSTYCLLLFNTKKGRLLRQDLEPFYDVGYKHIRQRSLFNYMPLVIIISVGFIYIRCIYRVIELSEGWRGYLITHEEYIFALDALMVLLTCITYVFFHPGLVFGKQMTAQISVSANKSESAADHESHCGNSRMYNYSKNHSNSPQSSHDEKFIMDQRQKYYNPYFLPTKFSQYNSHSCPSSETYTYFSYNSKLETKSESSWQNR